MIEQHEPHPLSRRLLVFGPAVIVLLTGILSFAGLQRSLNTRAWATHTRIVLDESSSLLNALLDAEAAQRGYLLTGDTTFLSPYRVARAQSDSELSLIRALTVDNLRQQRRLDTLGARMHERLAMIDSSIGITMPGRPATAVEILGKGLGRPEMVEVRRLIASVDANEYSLLFAREASERQWTTATSVILIVGTLIAALLAFAVNRTFDRALVDRRRALANERASNEQLQEQAVELELQADASQAAALEAELATERAEDAMHTAEASERRAEKLQGATETLSGALAIDEVAGLIVEQAVAAVQADSGLLATLSPSGEELQFVAVRNIPTISVGGTVSVRDERPLCIAARTGKPEIQSREGRSAGAFPMQYDGRVLGVLLVRFGYAIALSGVDVSLLNAISRIAAESFERARLFQAEREARTAAEGANRAKAAFLASMSHELRTPLQAALGFAQLVRSGVYGEINPQQAEVLGRVERSQLHLARLIDDILDFARIEAGRVRIAVEPVPIWEVFTELEPMVEPMAAAKQVRFFVQPTPRDLFAQVDRHRLRQILMNLIGNAIKFTPKEGTIDLSAARDHDRVTIRVTDTGPGIPNDRLESVFEPFVQVDDGLTRVHEGAGLGLAISRDLSRAMGGDLTVETELGRGSTFIVNLPAQSPSAEIL